ncbi:MAG: YcxB family protein [Bacteroidia bacterium]
MKLKYSLDEEDFLIHQLYMASKSERIQKKRMRNKWIVPAIYFVFGLFLLKDSMNTLGSLFILFAIFWVFLFPVWERKHYRKHYLDFIQDNYSERVGKTNTLEFTDESILSQTGNSDSKVGLSEIKGIIELRECIFVHLKNSSSYIIPKESLTNVDEVKHYLEDLSKNLLIKYTKELDWEWK